VYTLALHNPDSDAAHAVIHRSVRLGAAAGEHLLTTGDGNPRSALFVHPVGVADANSRAESSHLSQESLGEMCVSAYCLPAQEGGGCLHCYKPRSSSPVLSFYMLGVNLYLYLMEARK